MSLDRDKKNDCLGQFFYLKGPGSLSRYTE